MHKHNFIEGKEVAPDFCLYDYVQHKRLCWPRESKESEYNSLVKTSYITQILGDKSMPATVLLTLTELSGNFQLTQVSFSFMSWAAWPDDIYGWVHTNRGVPLEQHKL